ncbi:prepilin-type N-terminal cleavage/methylation domain-containing protein, partial [Vibrio parahaemolyticus]
PKQVMMKKPNPTRHKRAIMKGSAMLIYNTKRRAFTLVELSIVLVIIGLIIGGVLTGQQIIQNARITNALNGIQAYQAQFQTYVQNYGVLPGD